MRTFVIGTKHKCLTAPGTTIGHGFGKSRPPVGTEPSNWTQQYSRERHEKNRSQHHRPWFGSWKHSDASFLARPTNIWDTVHNYVLIRIMIHESILPNISSSRPGASKVVEIAQDRLLNSIDQTDKMPTQWFKNTHNFSQINSDHLRTHSDHSLEVNTARHSINTHLE
jgi:hypothetical protein